MSKNEPEKAADRQNLPTRREVMIAGGATLLGSTFLGAFSKIAQAQQMKPDNQHSGMTHADIKRQGITTKNGGLKPVILPEEGTKDPAIISLADNLFWTDILTEHGKFFVMLMPGPELAGPRGQAEQFQAQFASQHEKARSMTIDRSNFAEFNRSTIELVKPFIEFKHKMEEQQKSGKLNSLVWPTFFEHTAHEAERFVNRLTQLSRGSSEFDRAEVVDFWTRIMSEHADFIAHLLDPEERTLVNKAMQTSAAFRNLRAQKPGSKDPVEKAADDIIDFKTAALKGIQAGQIRSIIHPALGDHVRREAIKFADELKRIERG